MSSIFQERLRLLRGSANRKVFGECCGLSKNAIGKYERGEREPTLDAAVKIADYCEVSLDWLTGRKNF